MFMSGKKIEFYKAPSIDIFELVEDAFIATSGDIGIDSGFDSEYDFPF